MPAPVHRLKKAEIVWLANHRCEKHRVSYLDHYNCYLRENPHLQPKIAHFDIETTNLRATYGIILCWCLLDDETDEIHSDCITKEDLTKGTLDKRVVQSCVDCLEKFDQVTGYYSTKFDLPFIRTRAVKLGIPFPFYDSLKHIDVYYTVKSKFKLHSNKLAVACEALIGNTEKTIIDPDRWLLALQGDQKALDYILEHCERDVRDLKRLYHKVMEFRYPSMRSI